MNDFPNPDGPKPEGVSDSAWYGYTSVDSSKPLSQWTAWDSYADPSAQGYERYRSDKVDGSGKPIQGTFEHPDACPEGTTAFGHNQCLGLDDSRVKPYLDGSEGSIPGIPSGNVQNELPMGQPIAPQKPQMSTQPVPNQPLTWGSLGQTGQSSGGLSTQQNQNISILGTNEQQQKPQNFISPTPFQQKQKQVGQQKTGAFGYARQY